VRRGIIGSAIGLQFDQANHHLAVGSVRYDQATQQQPGCRQDVNGEVLAGKGLDRH
jgi:predicted dinucleotide-binding enzyme